MPPLIGQNASQVNSMEHNVVVLKQLTWEIHAQSVPSACLPLPTWVHYVSCVCPFRLQKNKCGSIYHKSNSKYTVLTIYTMTFALAYIYIWGKKFTQAAESSALARSRTHNVPVIKIEDVS